MRWAVRETVRQFVDAIGRPDMQWESVTGIFEGIGAYEARKGRSLDGLQAAVRLDQGDLRLSPAARHGRRGHSPE
ncbi:hypothetical protein ACQEU6_31255 [Spirillospora sp. CA-108201]